MSNVPEVDRGEKKVVYYVVPSNNVFKDGILNSLKFKKKTLDKHFC